MKIQEFIENHLLKRLEHIPSLVVYDPEKRYVSVVLSMSGDNCTVIDGSESTILGREQAMDAWRAMVDTGLESRKLIVYLPVSIPKTNEAKWRDPYQIFALGGDEFPKEDSESYQALCRQACPEKAVEIDRLFIVGVPDFETVNALITADASWPKLKTLLGAESVVEIMVSLLSPSQPQKAALDKDDSWIPELKTFLENILGLKLKTKCRQWSNVSDELWRFALFSEFVFDLPGELPEALKDVPKSATSTIDVIYKVCDRLRSSKDYQNRYMEMAEIVAQDLQLEKHMAQELDLGKLDTFAFEERTFLGVFAEAVQQGSYELATQVFNERKDSIWVSNDPIRQILWRIAEQAFEVIKQADDLGEPLATAGKNLDSMFGFYCERFRVLDSLHRSLEQALTEAYGELETVESLVEEARKKYLTLAELLQSKFISAAKDEGWPVSGWPRNTEVFAKFVAPWLDERKKVVLFMVDALRYELAIELENEMVNRYQTQIQPVCAQLPTTTSVGMAALMPKADGQLRLVREKDALVPYIGDHKVAVPDDRFNHVTSVYGDRCHMVDLDDLVSKPKLNIPETTQILLVKTRDIDLLGENISMEARRTLPQLIRKVIAGINKTEKKGFDRAVIATDHGFVLLDEQGIGNVVSKPSGEWIAIKSRCLLGKGSTGAGVCVFGKSDVGIDGDFDDYAVPATFATFSKGNPYFHEGLSLQECVLPVICVDFAKKQEGMGLPMPEIQLSYKGGTTNKITIRRPMVEIAMYQSGLFDEYIEFQVEAYSGKDLVGEAAASEHVNATTGMVSMKPGAAIKVPLKMQEDFQGSFEVRAVDPNTSLNLATLKLRTYYYME